MASTLTRRVAALEEKQLPAGGRPALKVLFIPCGLSEAEEEQWCAEHVPPAEALSPMVMVVRFLRPDELQQA